MQAIERTMMKLDDFKAEVLAHITALEAENERLRAESEERLQNAVALVAEVERLRKDAERYRWLRRNPTFLGWEGDFSESYIDREVDDAISTSMKDAK